MTSGDIARLSPETLAEIFSFYLADTHEPPKTPFFLAKICAFWRAVVWEHPRLWSSVEVHFSNEMHFDAQLDLLKIWLERSGACPLSISLTASGRDFTPARLSMIIDAVVPHCKRWQALKFDLPISSLDRLAAANCHFHLLAFVVVDLRRNVDGNSSEFLQKYIDAFKLAPQLRDVRFSANPSPFNLPVVFPWHQLTTFRGGNLTIEQCLGILRQTRNLTHCTFEEIYDFGEPLSLIPFHLPNLASLRLVFFRGADGDFQLLDYITVPALRELELTELLCPFPIDQLLALVARSGCSLEHLTIKCFSNTANHVVRCLRVMPSLVDFVVCLMDENRGNQIPLGPLAVLPRLSSLVVHYNHNQTSGLGHLAKSIITSALLTITLSGQTSSFPHAEFFGLLTRSACPLQSLSIQRTEFTAAQLSQLFSLVPSLVTLKLVKLKARTGTDKVISKLLPSEHGLLLPNLRVLQYHDAPSFRDVDLVDMLSTRWADASLRSVKITLSSGSDITPSVETVIRLRELVSDGMSISIHAGKKSWL